MATPSKGCSGYFKILDAVFEINRSILDANAPQIQSDPDRNIKTYYIATTILRMHARSKLLHRTKNPRESNLAEQYFESAYQEFIRLGYGPK